MIFPTATAVFAAMLAILYAGLSTWVIAGRVSGNVLHGDGGAEFLQKRIRSHGNFAEYVPLTLLLIGFLEAAGGAHLLIVILLLLLLIARVLHPIGMFAPANTPKQFACRGGGVILTISVMSIAAIALLIRLA